MERHTYCSQAAGFAGSSPAPGTRHLVLHQGIAGTNPAITAEKRRAGFLSASMAYDSLQGRMGIAFVGLRGIGLTMRETLV